MENNREMLQNEHREEDLFMVYYIRGSAKKYNLAWINEKTDAYIIKKYYDFCQEVLGVPWDGERFGQFIDYLQNK